MTTALIRKSACLLLFALLSLPVIAIAENTCDLTERKYHPGHYVSITKNSRNEGFDKLLVPGVQGFQIRYRWADLEPTKGQYELNAIRSDLESLKGFNTQLVAFVEDKSFDGTLPTPAYLHDYTLVNRNRGYTVKRWDPFVVERFNKLIAQIALEFDCHPNFEGIAIQESALSLDDITLTKNAYFANAYRDAIISTLNNASENMPHSQVFWYMNYLRKRQYYIREIAEGLDDKGVVMGGPDILPDNRSLKETVYPLYDRYKGRLRLLGSMQHHSYAHVKTTVPGAEKTYWSMEELFIFARDELHLNYIFWNHKTWRKPEDSFSWVDAVPVIEANPVFNNSEQISPPQIQENKKYHIKQEDSS